MTDCVFCKIAAGKLNTRFIYEDDQVVVFDDLHPKAKIHVLVTPKKHIPNLMSLDEDHVQLMAHTMLMIPEVARILGLKGFRTIINTGKEGGQEIDHLHIHMLAGDLPKFG